MTDVSTLTAEPVRIGQERRFPIALSRSIDSIRKLYDDAKQARWNPLTDVEWAELDPLEYDEATRDAARLVWSRRAWLEYPRLSDTPALLIRFCLEPGRESDPKYFLTVKNTEEAWQIETYHRMAMMLGGYVDRPPSKADERVFDQYRHISALRSGESLDGYFAAHCVLEAELELRLCTAYLEHAQNSVARQVLEKIVASKRRHAAFGWAYLDVRAPQWDDDARSDIAARVDAYICNVALRGLHCASLAGQTALAAATDLAAAHGLGAVASEEEVAILHDTLRDVAAEFKRVGVVLTAAATHGPAR